jgi:tetratricopeptide (TPR) repeat protein
MEKVDPFRMYLTGAMLLTVLIAAAVILWLKFQVPQRTITAAPTAQAVATDQMTVQSDSLSRAIDTPASINGLLTDNSNNLINSTNQINSQLGSINPNAAFVNKQLLDDINRLAINNPSALVHPDATTASSLQALQNQVINQEQHLNAPGKSLAASGFGASSQWQTTLQSRMRSTELGNLGLAHALQGNFSDAETLCNQGLTIAKQNLGPADVAARTTALADVYVREQKYQEAEPLYKQAIDMWQQILAAPSPDPASIMMNTMGTLQDTGIVPCTGYSPLSPRLEDLGYLYTKEGRLSEAESQYRQALSLAKEKNTIPNNPYFVSGNNHLADVLLAEHKYAEAEKLYKQSLGILVNNTAGFNAQPITETSTKLAAVLKAEGKQSEAQALESSLAGTAQ